MKKENINNHYTEEDLINFEKLNNFKDFKINTIKNKDKSHPQRYAKSDDENFDKIINVNNNKSLSKEIKKSDNKDNYYKSSDLKNFSKLKGSLAFNDYTSINNDKKMTKTITKYTANDENAFDQIIKSSNNKKNYKEKNINIKVDNAKIKIIDFNKLNEREKNFKNKVGIEKIKIVYFD